MHKIIIVDNHKMFRESLKFILSGAQIAEVIAEAGNGKEFLDLLDTHTPDLVLMDISMPEMDGIETTVKAMEFYPDMKILALSAYGEEKYYYKMIDAGAKGFILKDADISELTKAINTVIAGETWFSNELLRNVIKNIGKKRNINIELTEREYEILRHICKGFTNEQIANHIGLSKDTVRWHRNNIYSKTGASNSATLIIYALKNKIIEL